MADVAFSSVIRREGLIPVNDAVAHVLRETSASVPDADIYTPLDVEMEDVHHQMCTLAHRVAGSEPDFNTDKLAMYLLLWGFVNLGRKDMESLSQLQRRRNALLEAERTRGQSGWTVAQALEVFDSHSSGEQVRVLLATSPLNVNPALIVFHMQASGGGACVVMSLAKMRRDRRVADAKGSAALRLPKILD